MAQAELQNLHSDTLIQTVLDADGNNPGEAVVRRHNDAWLYFDQVDGYQLLDDITVQQLVLT